MLCQFTFQNFKSYKNETTLDYQAAVLPEFKDTLITEASASDLLPVMSSTVQMAAESQTCCRPLPASSPRW